MTKQKKNKFGNLKIYTSRKLINQRNKMEIRKFLELNNYQVLHDKNLCDVPNIHNSCSGM